MARESRVGARVVILGLAAMIAAGFSVVPVAAQQAPALPDPVPVTVDVGSTALLTQDISETPCNSPSCQALVPAIAALQARARDAGVYVIHSTGAGGTLLPPVVPAPGEVVVLAQGSQDRFYNTNLDYLLRSHGIGTVILQVWRVNGSIMYTAFGGTNRGYSVVVPLDGTSANTDWDITVGRYQIQNQSNANPTNEPLRPAAVTLSRTDLITFE
jgi:nicotinamidase-related amidase